MEFEELCKKAVIKWGVDAQIDMMIEECSELITALQHFKRGRENNVAEELADVEIVLNQIRPFFNQEGEVDSWFYTKSKRLEDRVENKGVK